MFRAVRIFLMLLVIPVAVHAAEFNEGFEYKLITPPQPTSTGDKIEVVEMFWYGCPHCYRFEPEIKKWLASKPANVEFVRIPAVFSKPVWELHARAYYTAEALGVLEKIHQPLFDAIHKDKQRMDSPAALRSLFSKFAVSGDDFDKAFTSFVVMSKLQRARTLSRDYQITGVPSLIINGKYVTSGPMASINNPSKHEHENLLKVMAYLIDKESASKTATK